MTYKGYEIETASYGYTVTFCGDEVVFETVEQARQFIDGLEG